MSLFNKTKTESEKKGLQLQLNHTLITEDQAETFTHMVRETVKIIAVGAVVSLAAALALKLGSDVLTNALIEPNP